MFIPYKIVDAVKNFVVDKELAYEQFDKDIWVHSRNIGEQVDFNTDKDFNSCLLVLLNSSDWVFITKMQKYSLSKGDLIIFNPRVPYKFAGLEGGRLAFMCWDIPKEWTVQKIELELDKRLKELRLEL